MNLTRLAAFTIAIYLNGHFAWSHDPVTGLPNWIYQNHRACCGPEDCKPIEAGEYEVRSDGVWLPATEELIPFADILQSEDFKAWRCQYLYGNNAGKTRCLFLPGAS